MGDAELGVGMRRVSVVRGQRCSFHLSFPFQRIDFAGMRTEYPEAQPYCDVNVSELGESGIIRPRSN